MAEPILELSGVIKEYGEAVKSRVLHGIDLRVEAGEFAAIIGPSGSGKSTLLNLIGLLDRPTAGRIALRGRVTSEMSEDELTAFRGRALGFVFQFHHLLPELTAIENVMVPEMAVSGWYSLKMESRAIALLAEVGIDEAGRRRVTDLSGGQQQRVAIARALANNPPLVLADEPTGNLDTQTADQVFQLLRRINQQRGTTFLFVTHDPRLAERCDRVIHIIDGRIASDERRSSA